MSEVPEGKIEQKRAEPIEEYSALMQVRKVFAAPLALFCFFFTLFIGHDIYQGIGKGIMKAFSSRGGKSKSYAWDIEPISYLFALSSNILIGAMFLGATIALTKRLLKKDPVCR